jgi:hypothetical protein
MEKVALGEGFLIFLWFFLLSIIPPELHISWRMNSRPVGGCSSDMYTDPTDMSNNNNNRTLIAVKY